MGSYDSSIFMTERRPLVEVYEAKRAIQKYLFPDGQLEKRTGGGTDLCEAAARVRHPNAGRKLCAGLGDCVSRGEGAAHLLRRGDEGNALLAPASSD